MPDFKKLFSKNIETIIVQKWNKTLHNFHPTKSKDGDTKEISFQILLNWPIIYRQSAGFQGYSTEKEPQPFCFISMSMYYSSQVGG